jgi:hypothetical protein
MSNFSASNGQGNRFSRTCHTLSTTNSSIIARLTSRSLCGQSLHIHVHQHFGFRLHLLWKCANNHATSEKCIERRFFTCNDIDTFCFQLRKGTLEGLCNCVWGRGRRILGFLKHKVHPCYNGPSLSFPMYCQPTGYIKHLQDYHNIYPCSCHVQKSPLVHQWATDSSDSLFWFFFPIFKMYYTIGFFGSAVRLRTNGQLWYLLWRWWKAAPT